MIGAAAALLMLAAPDGAVRPALLDLAYALGEAHGLSRTCRGREEARWRSRMSAVLDRERPAREARLQMVDRFNAGYAAARAVHPACDPEARTALADALARAAPLARRLARDD